MAAARHNGSRREGILAAAGGVFDARGYAAATVEEVAQRAKIAKGSVYNYFRSKQALFTAVFAEAWAADMAQAEEMLQQPLPAGERICRLLDSWYALLPKHKGTGRLVLEFWATAAREKRSGELSGWFRQMYAHWRGRLAEVIAGGVEAGEFAPGVNPLVAAALILAVMDGIAVQTILDVGLKVDEEFFSRMKRAILTALTAGANGPSGGAVT